MVTARRSSEVMDTFERNNSSVDLLERSTPKSYSDFSSVSKVNTEDFEEAKERMRRNLNKILGYDKFPEETTVVEEATAQAVEISSDEEEVDIEPSKTTLQFVNENMDEIYSELKARSESKVVAPTHLTKRQKVVAALVTVAITIMLTLIVLNASLLASFSKLNQAKAAELASVETQYNQLMTEIDRVSGAEHIIDVAENQYGMVKGN